MENFEQQVSQHETKEKKGLKKDYMALAAAGMMAIAGLEGASSEMKGDNVNLADKIVAETVNDAVDFRGRFMDAKDLKPEMQVEYNAVGKTLREIGHDLLRHKYLLGEAPLNNTGETWAYYITREIARENGIADEDVNKPLEKSVLVNASLLNQYDEKQYHGDGYFSSPNQLLTEEASK